MDTNFPKNKEEFLVYLWGEKKACSDMRNNMASDLSDKRITLFTERKTFFQNLVIASITLLGLVSAFSVLTENTALNNLYFIIGVSLHIFLICFVAVYLRETIDQDIEGLSKSQDSLSELVKDKIELVEKFILDLTNRDFDYVLKFQEYVNELKRIPSVQELVRENERLDVARKSRIANKVHMEFNGEIAVFSYVCGTIFIFLSILGSSFPKIYLGFGLLLIFYTIFTDFLGKVSTPIFKVLTFITRRDILSTIKYFNIRNKYNNKIDKTNEFSFIIKPSEHGVGVFTTHNIKKGAHLRLFIDEETTKYKSRTLNKKDVPEIFRGHCLDRGETMICPPDFGAIPIGWYVNHSSNPNSAPGNNPNTHRKYRWYAIRDINEGEEILFDYTTLEEPGKYFYNY